jgi:hypothetical protein
MKGSIDAFFRVSTSALMTPGPQPMASSKYVVTKYLAFQPDHLAQPSSGAVAANCSGYY